METKKIRPRRIGRHASYTAKLLGIGVGEESNFRLMGGAYPNYYTAKWRLEKSKTATFRMERVDKWTLKVIRTS